MEDEDVKGECSILEIEDEDSGLWSIFTGSNLHKIVLQR